MHIAIIGNGISGISAARYLRKLNPQCRISVISAETRHFFSRTALMYMYMGHLTYENTKPYENDFWQKNRIELVYDYVKQVDFDQKTLHLLNNGHFQYDKLLLATGSRSNRFGWPGQDAEGVQGLYSMQDLQLMEQNTQGITQAVVVGGGLIGIEVAEMLLSKGIGVTFLVRESSFWNNVLPPEESAIINQHITQHHINLHLNTELQAILPDANEHVRAVLTNTGAEIPCQFVALTVGVSPNIDFLRHTPLEVARGILVNEYLETNLPDVYAAGDCAEFKQALPGRRAIEQVWYTGQMQGIAAAHNILGAKTAYNPRIWFNSAKFLDIEYQIYGNVPTQLKDNEAQFYWQHPDGQKCIRLVFEAPAGRLIGVNSLGIRLRHQVLEQWLLSNTPVTRVLEQFTAAMFDPELYQPHQKALIAQYNAQYPEQPPIQLKSKRSLLKIIFG